MTSLESISLTMQDQSNPVAVQEKTDNAIEILKILGLPLITQFATRFVTDARVIYVGDTGDKTALFSSKVLEKLNVTVNLHGTLPDIVLYYRKENWLLLVEVLARHGPINPKCHSELAGIFRTSTAGIVYVTAFPSRLLMAVFFSWKTEVWCADTPSYLIHFDGHSFLGPFQD